MAIVWRLKNKQDRRFRSGHPWVYSNELAESPKGIEPGDPVELRDASGGFLARGYGNPGSLISFRAVSRVESESEPLSAEGIGSRLEAARKFRERIGLGQVSHRLCFGEADQLPGLIVDAYRLGSHAPVEWAFVVQAHTAGMDRALPRVFEALQSLRPGSAIVERSDVGVRKLEGLNAREPRVVTAPSSMEDVLSQCPIRVRSAVGGAPLVFFADLLQGQKTGFFLDQGRNIELALSLLVSPASGKKNLRVLDLCSYVGQWGAQIARAAKEGGGSAHVTAMDASAQALELARENVRAQGGEVETLRGDVMEDLGELPSGAFDLVIVDPPALIKGRKHLKPGMHGYLQLNTQSLRLLKGDGGIVSCSCSALLGEEDFFGILARASGRNPGFPPILWIGRGSQGPDHPILAEFPEGRYLKCWIGARR